MASSDQEPDPGKTPPRLDLASRILRPHWIFRRALGVGLEDEAVPVSAEPSAAAAIEVICCGMYRACSTWQYEVAAHLVEQKLGGERLGYLAGPEYQAVCSTRADSPARSRVLKSHDASPALGCALEQGRALGLYSYRDPRDVVFSLMHKRGLSFRGLARQGMLQRILANDRFWTRRPRVLIERYEDLLADPPAGVERIARHLGIELEPDEAERIAAEYSREANRERARALAHRLHEAGVDLENAAGVQICDPGTLLHWNHLREGGDGAWRVLATPRQIAMLDRVFGPWLVSHGYARESAPGALGLRKRIYERIQDECDLAVGRARLMMGSLAARLPGPARLARRLLGLGEPAGAIAWSPAAGRSRQRHDAPAQHAGGRD